MATPPGPWLFRLLALREEDARPALWSALCFFFVLAGWFVSRPVRESMGAVEGTSTLQWLFVATLVGMTFLNPLFSWCISRCPRRIFAPAAFLIFALNLWLFAGLLAEVRDGEGHFWSRFFYVWSSIFNLFVVSVFWAFMGDLWGRESGKRLFGLIGVGGTLGALAGGLTASRLVTLIGVEGLLILGGTSMAAAAFTVIHLGRIFKQSPRLAAIDQADEPTSHTPQSELAVTQGGAWGGLTAIARSPALLAMAAYMIFLASTQTYLYFEQQRIVKAAFGADTNVRAAAFARLDVYVQSATVLLQVFATSRLVRRLGIGGSLAALPAIVLAGAVALAITPTFAMLALFQVARRAGDYALARPAREAWYAGLSRNEKYKAKSFIDTFAYRAGDTLGAWALGGVKAATLGAAGALALFAPIVFAWAAIALWIGRSDRRAPRALTP